MSIDHGLHVVGDVIGEVSVKNELTVSLVRGRQGYVDCNRVGYGKFNPHIDLHIFAAPLEIESLGRSLFLTGVSWLNLRADRADQALHTTTAHEVAHSLGFVDPDAPNHDKKSRMHCDGDCCLMNQYYEFPIVTRHITAVTERLFRDPVVTTVDQHTAEQQRFCGDCESHMRQRISSNLFTLRHMRMTRGTIIRDDELRRLNQQASPPKTKS